MLFNKNDKIGIYTVQFQHKKSTYAETYRVKDPSGTTRFLKLIDYSKLSRTQINDDGQILEVEIAKQLDHPNLCRFVDAENLTIRGSRYAYMVKEYVSGETLSQRLVHDDDLSVYEIKQVAKAALSALSFLHTLPQPVIHNEVTIQNLLINLTGELCDLKLIDFGHARYLNQVPLKPDLNDLNLFYLAPERFSGICSVRTDLYAVGVIMYRLLYGELPWFIDVSRIDSVDKIDALLAEREKELEIPSIEMFELDEQFVNTIIKSLSYDAEDRFESASDFIKAIDGELKVQRQSTKRKNLSGTSPIKEDKIKVSKKSGDGFAAIAGMDDLKKQLREEVIEPLNNPEEYKRYGITIPNGMLLYGPPGCGKTFFAKHFAEEVGFNFMCITPATLKSRYVNATQENIANMFKEAEENAPTIIFIDEINELVPNRESDVHEMSRSAVNEMLAQMDRTGEKGVFIIGATNYPYMIDPAILRAGRLDKKYYIGVPDKEARKALFILYLKTRPYDFGLDYDKLADMTQNYVSADIQLIVNDASRKALKLHCRITMDILKETIKETKSSLTQEELNRYIRIKQQMEGVQIEKKRPQIGFK
ncbi:AAA family ATPase [uncultured Bacteroides sp.]|uniref:AAA family ATPase n=1 Tax=uncultured Bacteroides sp. TaxID=162156 RepID=UPI002602376F|nr:AAA family ATPase [uncultured Bacteroides sp.]